MELHSRYLSQALARDGACGHSSSRIALFLGREMFVFNLK